eukprot:9651900-Alexandrium_andersonii.AAC.1
MQPAAGVAEIMLDGSVGQVENAASDDVEILIRRTRTYAEYKAEAKWIGDICRRTLGGGRED